MIVCHCCLDRYAALALFALLRFPMSFLPMLITMVVNALVALKRIGGFLNKSESELGKVRRGRVWEGPAGEPSGRTLQCALKGSGMEQGQRLLWRRRDSLAASQRCLRLPSC